MKVVGVVDIVVLVRSRKFGSTFNGKRVFLCHISGSYQTIEDSYGGKSIMLCVGVAFTFTFSISYSTFYGFCLYRFCCLLVTL